MLPPYVSSMFGLAVLAVLGVALFIALSACALGLFAVSLSIVSSFAL